ncbi:fimbrial protein [Aeromonas veronii]|uniref:fimbrial protein n=1 Tax=Aeromonas veronii TaxID=654 RepID=UPI00226CC743|nr:fimbrial protein [Aeromonas veronii]MCX9114730.1 fimbrial protein [Aeromonas veronii]
MKKNIISAAILLSVSSLGMSVNAAEIQFNGTVTASSCKLVDNENLVMQLPTVGITDVKDVGLHSGVTTLSASVQCENAKTDGLVTMALMPNKLETKGKVLLNTAEGDTAAKGVGIVVMGTDGNPLDFSSGDNAKITAPMTSGNANILISATYAKDGTGDEITGGDVTAVLPFAMTYE